VIFQPSRPFHHLRFLHRSFFRQLFSTTLQINKFYVNYKKNAKLEKSARKRDDIYYRISYPGIFVFDNIIRFRQNFRIMSL